jgi:hypothetical protein
MAVRKQGLPAHFIATTNTTYYISEILQLLITKHDPKVAAVNRDVQYHSKPSRKVG